MNNLTPEQKGQVEKRLGVEPVIWLSTVRPDGRPHTTPVWFYWDGTHVYFGSQDGRRKLRNLAANPHVTVTLPDPHDVVIIEGEAEFVGSSEIGAIMAGYGQKYAQAMQALGMDLGGQEGFRLVRVTPRKFLVWGMPSGSNQMSESESAKEEA